MHTIFRQQVVYRYYMQFCLSCPYLLLFWFINKTLIENFSDGKKNDFTPPPHHQNKKKQLINDHDKY